MSLAHGAEIVKRPEVTLDAFLGGRITLTQPARGFRAGLDSVLLGAAVGRGEGDLLDLGAGVGTASLVALAHHPALAATLVEADAQTAGLARENIASNGFAERANVLELDLTASGRARGAAGLSPDHFVTVIANPPFFEAGTAPQPSRAAARHMSAEALDAWVKTAATHAAPGGEVIFIHVAEKLPALLASFPARFGAITVLPLVPREGAPANRILLRGIKGSRAPLTLLASRVVHTPSGRTFRPEFEAIFRGEGRLHW
ncbi:MAG TPA: methyltransferase [Devosia sp.]|jgi:tRNA1(Val) A37 N6-methylase TrmN6|nr:methyltransferase [Devosia sp.]